MERNTISTTRRLPTSCRWAPSRRIGDPDEVADLAAFLASDRASFINGVDIVFDGGVSAMGG